MQSVKVQLDQHPYYNREAQAYVSGDEALKPFYTHAPRVEVVADVVAEKEKNFTQKQRDLLVGVLEEQYRNLDLPVSSKSAENIDRLREGSTFTVTTGQQIHIFFGPLFFLYKALSAINTAEHLNKKYPDKHFVPLFWMASEDHDFDEIKSVKVYGQEFEWKPLPDPHRHLDLEDALNAISHDRGQGNKYSYHKGAGVGRIDTDQLVKLCDEIEEKLDDEPENKKVIQIFREAYSNSEDFAKATQKVLYQLMHHRGLVVLDPDDKRLKTAFIPAMKRDILDQFNYDSLKRQTRLLKEAGFKPQIGAQSINFFYMGKADRIKIKARDKDFRMNDFTHTRAEMEKMIDLHPSEISPNVALRPLYQETILPNVIYIAGTSELKYWLQLKAVFEANEVPQPMVLLRNSYLLVSEKNHKKVERRFEDISHLFLSDEGIAAKYDSKVTRGLEAVYKLIQEGDELLSDIKEKVDQLPINRVPHSGYKSLEKGLKQIKNALEEVNTGSEGVSKDTQELIRLKNKISSGDHIQERTTDVINHLPLLKDLVNVNTGHGFDPFLHILLTK